MESYNVNIGKPLDPTLIILGVKNGLLLLDPTIKTLPVVSNVDDKYLTSYEFPFNPIGNLIVVHCPLA